MMAIHDEDLSITERVELSLSQAKRVQREARNVVQSLARIRDDLITKAEKETADSAVE